MIIFFGNGIVWDKENNKRLCKFINGKYTTNDPREAEILKKYFEYEGEIEIEKEEIEDEEIEETNELECDECGFVAKTDRGLKAHKQKH